MQVKNLLEKRGHTNLKHEPESDSGTAIRSDNVQTIVMVRMQKTLKSNNILKVVTEMLELSTIMDLITRCGRCRQWQNDFFCDHLVISWRNQWDLRFNVLLVVIVTRKEMDTWWLVLCWNSRALVCWDKT